MNWTRRGIVLAVVLAVFAVARLVYGHEPSRFDVLLAGIIIIGVGVEEGFEKVYKRLDEIAEAIGHDK